MNKSWPVKRKKTLRKNHQLQQYILKVSFIITSSTSISSSEPHLVTNLEEGVIEPSPPNIPQLHCEDVVYRSGKEYVQGEC
jgi:hypothetical protein